MVCSPTWSTRSCGDPHAPHTEIVGILTGFFIIFFLVVFVIFVLASTFVVLRVVFLACAIFLAMIVSFLLFLYIIIVSKVLKSAHDPFSICFP
jgi:hypothetical protein